MRSNNHICLMLTAVVMVWRTLTSRQLVVSPDSPPCNTSLITEIPVALSPLRINDPAPEESVTAKPEGVASSAGFGPILRGILIPRILYIMCRPKGRKAQVNCSSFCDFYRSGYRGVSQVCPGMEGQGGDECLSARRGVPSLGILGGLGEWRRGE